MDVEAFVLAKAAINGALGTDELETEAKQIKPAINELYQLIEELLERVADLESKG